VLNVDYGLFVGIGCNILLVVMREQFVSLNYIRKLVRSPRRGDLFVDESDFIKLIDTKEVRCVLSKRLKLK
jgi:hypothetical protein